MAWVVDEGVVMVPSSMRSLCDALPLATPPRALIRKRAGATTKAVQRHKGRTTARGSLTRPAYDVKLSPVLNLVGLYRSPVNNPAQGPQDVLRENL